MMGARSLAALKDATRFYRSHQASWQRQRQLSVVSCRLAVVSGGGSQYRDIPRSPTRRLVPDLADEIEDDCETGKPEESSQAGFFPLGRRKSRTTTTPIHRPVSGPFRLRVLRDLLCNSSGRGQLAKGNELAILPQILICSGNCGHISDDRRISGASRK
jgi:hypothetical protein